MASESSGDQSGYTPHEGLQFDDERLSGVDDYTSCMPSSDEVADVLAAEGYVDTGIVPEESLAGAAEPANTSNEQPVTDELLLDHALGQLTLIDDPWRMQDMDPADAQHLLGQADALREVATQLANREHARLRNELVDGIDWHAVFTNMSEQTSTAILELVADLNPLAVAAFEDNLEKMVESLHILQVWQSSFREAGRTLGPDAIKPVPADWQLNPELGEQMVEWHVRVRHTTALLSKDRTEALAVPLVDSLVVPINIYNIHQKIGAQVGDPYYAGVPLPIAHALERYSIDLQHALYNADYEYRARTPIAPLEVKTGAYEAQLCELLGVASPEIFIATVLRRHPAPLISHMAAIEFVDDLPPVVFADGTQEQTTAQMSNTTHTMKINMGAKSVENMRDTSETDDTEQGDHSRRMAQMVNRIRFKDIIDHEAFHHGQQERIPLEWLIEWDEIEATDRLSVTDYAARSRSKSEDAGRRENGADAGMLYMSRPRTLSAVSSRRFEALNKLYQRYTDAMIEMSQMAAPHDSMATRFVQDASLAKRADNQVEWGLFERRQEHQGYPGL